MLNNLHLRIGDLFVISFQLSLDTGSICSNWLIVTLSVMFIFIISEWGLFRLRVCLLQRKSFLHFKFHIFLMLRCLKVKLCFFRLSGLPERGDFSCFSKKVTSKRRRVCSESKKSFVDPQLQFHFDNFDYVQGCDLNRKTASKWASNSIKKVSRKLKTYYCNFWGCCKWTLFLTTYLCKTWSFF